MPTATECICCNDLSDVNAKRMEKNVDCITEYSGFRCNCLEIDVLEADYYEYQETNEPSLEGKLIREYVFVFEKYPQFESVLIVQFRLHIEIHVKQSCNITFPFLIQEVEVQSIPKIRAMGLEETRQKNRRVLPDCVVSKTRQRFVSEGYCSFKYPT